MLLYLFVCVRVCVRACLFRGGLFRVGFKVPLGNYLSSRQVSWLCHVVLPPSLWPYSDHLLWHRHTGLDRTVLQYQLIYVDQTQHLNLTTHPWSNISLAGVCVCVLRVCAHCVFTCLTLSTYEHGGSWQTFSWPAILAPLGNHSLKITEPPGSCCRTLATILCLF